jgi:hypothetical protein
MTPLYKFIGNPERARSILGGEVKFTPPSELNDPAELNPTFNRDAVTESLRILRTTGYSEQDMLHLGRQAAVLRILAPEFPRLSVPETPEEATMRIRSPRYDSTSDLDQYLMSMAEVIRSKVGFFCLSKRFDSLPMWAHYAANASGFVIEYVNLDEIFCGDATGVLSQIRNVRYEREIEGVTFDPCSHESLFFTKYSDWSYEAEARVVLPLAECRAKPAEARKLYLYDLPSESLNRLVLGWNIDPSKSKDIQAAVAEINPCVQVVQAQFRRGEISLDDPCSL